MRPQKRTFGFLAGLFALVLFAATAQASLLTSDVGYGGPGLDLSAYATGSYNFTFGPEPIPGGITFTAAPGGGGNSGSGSVLGQGSYGLGANGSFDLPAVYAGVDSGTGYAQFEFAAPINSFGAYFNYAPGFGDNATISVLDALDNVLESWDLTAFAPISTPGGFNQFAFRGIDLGNSTFSTFRFGGNYILAAASSSGNPTGPGQQPVPEPGTMILLGIGLGALGIFRFSKKGN